MLQNNGIFRVYSILCMNNIHTGEYSYLVQSNDGLLSYFTSNELPAICRKFLELHNEQRFVLLLDWQNYLVYADPIPQILRDG